MVTFTSLTARSHHKSRAQRREENVVRRKASLSDLIDRLHSALRATSSKPNDPALKRLVLQLQSQLKDGYILCGVPPAEAESTAQAIANRIPVASWLSFTSPTDVASSAQRNWPSCVSAALAKISKVIPGATAVLLCPHSHLPAIKVSADGPHCEGSFSVDLSIQEIDILSAACRSSGLTVYHHEDDYLLHQLALA